ncbi:MAG TPA: DNA translocase FtsK 4TM domain-containing protein [Candidatus Binatia bacterium]|jgi:S-DNA-T family DNA segregation ATPase FtsK/SpoIIIE|nr:DNA translocase FtsK 4TM domain-containing protein [Candidatus Binatia bacterium]
MKEALSPSVKLMGKESKINREIGGVVIFVFALFIALSLLSYDPKDQALRIAVDSFDSGIASLKALFSSKPSQSSITSSLPTLDTHNWGGFVGACLARVLRVTLGLSAYLLPVFLAVVSYSLMFKDHKGLRLIEMGGFALLLLSIAVILDLFLESGTSEDAARAGGIIGGYFRQAILVPYFGQIGTYVISFSLLPLSVMLLSEISLVAIGERTHREIGRFRKNVGVCIKTLTKQLREWDEKRRAENKKKEQREYVPPPIILKEEIKEAKEIKDEPPRRSKKKSPPVQEEFPLPEFGHAYKLPTPSLLDPPDAQHVEIDNDTLNAISLTLQRKLTDLGVEGQVKSVSPGPVITMFKFEPAAGVKVRRIITLADDLAMALRALNVRILAPIPGEPVVGIEIPNPRREKVFLHQVIGSDAYQSAQSKLTLALGKDISGAPFVTDLAPMPHLLVAGATGTGKSVSINAMILSILYKATPQDVQFIMIDPKMLELTVYEDLPHLLAPVVTDPKKAASALFWAMDEMDRRYRLMRDKGARNIDHYNRLLEKEMVDKRDLIDLTQPDEPGEGQEIGGNLKEEAPLVHERLPRIVIIVDELADLMMSVRSDIEEHVTRLAQKARAAGIHLILATQRPSVDVITGLIKANFPARISFQVTSRVDSRTILDSIGAERLLGDGDMLFLPPGTARITRVHGAFVSDQEVRKVVEFIKQQAKPRYRPEVFEAKKEIEAGDVEEDNDEMYDQAVRVVTDSQQASISMVQRRLRVGYNRAARLIERMEREGVVGPSEGAKPREVYARKLDE